LYGERAWEAAFQALSDADRESPLEAHDLELLALAAYLTGRDDEYLSTLERAYNAHLETSDMLRAFRCAFWLGFRVLMRGEMGRANGWFAHAQRLLEQDARDCAERGYLLLPTVGQGANSGDNEAAYTAAAEAAAIGQRCGDLDLLACARMEQGRIRLQQGQVGAGLSRLDEAMVLVISGKLSPLVTGLMYCSVIQACLQVYAFDRTREWTVALTQWCEGQPDMVAFVGACQVHRAEIMQLLGTWPEAIEEARRACLRSQTFDRRAVAAALYQQAEVHRLRGEFEEAEQAYRGASQLGLEPQPGLALLRLVQGRTKAASIAIRRVAGTTKDRLTRMSVLPASVEIMLALGAVPDARDACGELEEIACSLDTGVPDAIAAEARGAVELAEGNARGALDSLRRAFGVWQRIDAPYRVARLRVLIGQACHSLGDDDGASLEFDAAKSTFERLGAAPDLARIDSLKKRTPTDQAHGLTRRELQVLRLVATGDTNKAIATELGLSERTIERHLNNIFTKLDVSTRSAATAWAYERKIV
jgi:DNA-binding CsgD family transcriptional regulator